MALWRVPWAVNGEGVEHSATLARHANFSTGATQTGISGVTSLRVSAGETPGAFVNVGPGSGVITYAQGRVNQQDRAYASFKDQSVPVRNDALAQVPIEPTTSAGGRNDLVIVEVNDPEAEGTSDTVDYSTHEFVRFHVIQGVGSTVQYPHQLPVLERPILPLARVNIPASTATITDEMITDVRHLAYVQSELTPLQANANTSGQFIDIPPEQTDWQTVFTFTDLVVPTFTTRAHLSMSLGPLYAIDGTARGHFRLLYTGQNASIATPSVPLMSESIADRYTPITAGSVPVSWRTAGSTAQVALQVRRQSTAPGTGTLRLPGGGEMVLIASGWVTHQESPRFDTEAGG